MRKKLSMHIHIVRKFNMFRIFTTLFAITDLTNFNVSLSPYLTKVCTLLK